MSTLTKPAGAPIELLRLDARGHAAVVVASWILAELSELEIEEVLDDSIRFIVRSGEFASSGRLRTLVDEGRFEGWRIAGDDPGSTFFTRAPDAS